MAQEMFIDVSWAILFFPPLCHLLIIPIVVSSSPCHHFVVVIPHSSLFSHHHPLIPSFIACRHPDAHLH
jgi:hypothetical protein